MPSCCTQIIRSRQMAIMLAEITILKKNSAQLGGTSISMSSTGPSAVLDIGSSPSTTSTTTSETGYSIQMVYWGKKRPVMAGTTYIQMMQGERVVMRLFS